MPDPAPPAPPPATTTPPPAKPARVSDDPFMARLLGDMGKAVNTDGVLSDAPIHPAPEGKPDGGKFEITSMGEHARFKREREESEAAKKAAKPPETDAKKPDEPPPETPAEKPEPQPDPAAAKPIPVERAKPLEEVIEGVVKRLQVSPPPAPEQQTQPDKPAADPDADYIARLNDQQRDEYEMAVAASKYMPEKYGQQPKKLIDYLKKIDAHIEAKKKEDPDWDHEQDESYARLIRESRPIIPRSDQRKIDHEQISEQVRADIEKKYQPRLEESDRRARAIEAKPEIESAITTYRSTLVDKLAEGENNPLAPVMAAVKEKGWAAASEIDPSAAVIAKSYADQAEVMGKEYIELATGLKEIQPYDPKLPADAPVNQHAIMQDRLLNFVEHQENLFAQGGGKLLIQNGKQFATRREFSALTPAQRATRWTLSHVDVLEILSSNASSQAQKAYESEQKRLAAAGYVKAPKPEITKKETAPAPETPEPPRVSSPKATTSPSPGATVPQVPPKGNALFSHDELKRMQSGGHASWVG